MKYLLELDKHNQTMFLQKMKQMIIDGSFIYDTEIVKGNFLKLLHETEDYMKRFSPPVFLETNYNLKGISEQYKIPFGFTNIDFENLMYAFMDDEEITNILFSELLNKNSKLSAFKKVKYKSEWGFERGAVIGGACSQMNISDISDYINNGTEITSTKNGKFTMVRTDNNSELYTSLYNQVIKSGISISWFPSIPTLNNILDQVNKQ